MNELTDLAKIVKRADRVHQVLSWIVSGQSQHDIQQTVEKEWQDAKLRPLIVEAMKRIGEAADETKTEDGPELLRGWAIEASREIYRRAMDTNDLPVAMKAIRQILDLANS